MTEVGSTENPRVCLKDSDRRKGAPDGKPCFGFGVFIRSGLANGSFDGMLTF